MAILTLNYRKFINKWYLNTSSLTNRKLTSMIDYVTIFFIFTSFISIYILIHTRIYLHIHYIYRTQTFGRTYSIYRTISIYITLYEHDLFKAPVEIPEPQQCEDGWMVYNGKCYLFAHDALTFSSAEVGFELSNCWTPWPI